MTHTPAPDDTPIPADDPSRKLVASRVGDDSAKVVHLVGDTYTILLTGDDTGGQFTLIDMVVPPGGGPPPHRHDFEETFTVLEGQIEVAFRTEKHTLRPGDTANIPANAPHSFSNIGETDAHLLCTCAPAGQDEFFARVDAGENPGEIAAQYRTEMLDA